MKLEIVVILVAEYKFVGSKINYVLTFFRKCETHERSDSPISRNLSDIGIAVNNYFRLGILFGYSYSKMISIMRPTWLKKQTWSEHYFPVNSLFCNSSEKSKIKHVKNNEFSAY